MQDFHPLTAEWFRGRFAAATAPQLRAWPAIRAGRDVLVSAPTGSGKTLAAFLICLDRLVAAGLAGRLDDRVEVVYVSPLKALSNDIGRNLETPLAELEQLAFERGMPAPGIRTAVRTGDTPAWERERMVRRPPHILVTTPESLFILLTAERSRAALRNAETVIVDEIHALADDKRGSHLALTLARLDDLVRKAGKPRPQRVGLSATVRPIEAVARFLRGPWAPMRPSARRRRLPLQAGRAGRRSPPRCASPPGRCLPLQTGGSGRRSPLRCPRARRCPLLQTRGPGRRSPPPIPGRARRVPMGRRMQRAAMRRPPRPRTPFPVP